MNISTPKIDILENALRRIGNLLDILLIDRTTKRILFGRPIHMKNVARNFTPKIYYARISF